MSKEHRGEAAATNAGGEAFGAPGKRTRTVGLTGARIDRLRPGHEGVGFGSTEIGATASREIAMTNTSSEAVTIADASIIAHDHPPGPRVADEISIAGPKLGAPLDAGAATTLTVTFVPHQTYADDLVSPSFRSGEVRLLDDDGAIAGSFGYAGHSVPNSRATHDMRAVTNLAGRVRSSRATAPRTYEDLLSTLIR